MADETRTRVEALINDLVARRVRSALEPYATLVEEMRKLLAGVKSSEQRNHVPTLLRIVEALDQLVTAESERLRQLPRPQDVVH